MYSTDFLNLPRYPRTSIKGGPLLRPPKDKDSMATSRHISHPSTSEAFTPGLGPLSGETEPRQWRSLLLRMLTETDTSKLELAAADLEKSIFLRYQQMQSLESGDVVQERRELREACDRLAIVRVKKLGYPEWREKKADYAKKRS